MNYRNNQLLLLMKVAIKAAVRGGNILQENSQNPGKIRHKESHRDVVTALDVYVQKEIIKILKNRSQKYPIVAEETLRSRARPRGTYWLVDPLDGTANYINNIPFYAVSVAFILEGKPVVGVIFNPHAKELFYGAQGFGAYCNSQPLTYISRNPAEALFAVTFSGKRYSSSSGRKKEFLEFGRVNDATMGCLRLGSAALNLAYCAQGRFGGCWGRANKWWDVAAGLLLVKLAGGATHWKFLKKNEWLVEYSAGELS